MKREWLAFIEGLEQGPYSVQELKVHPHVNPDTFVRKKNWNKWVPIRQVFELRDIFKDRPKSQSALPINSSISDNGLQTLTFTPQNPFFTFLGWLIILSLIIFFVYFVYA